MKGPGKRTAVLLDRDGTINEDADYLSDSSGVALIEGAAKAIRLLNERGVKVAVLTNQSGVGRGFFTVRDVDAVNARLEELLAAEGASVDAIYHCPHSPDDGCECRKPGTAMAMQAAKELGLELETAYMVGDKSSDMALARAIDAKGVLVLTGKGEKEAASLSVPPDFIAKDLLEAVEWILGDIGREGA